MGTQQPLPKRGTAFQFSSNVCCGQTAGWTKMPLGIKVDIVLDWDTARPLPSKKGEHSNPNFGACLVAKRLHGSRCHLVRGLSLGPGHIVLHGDTAPPKNGHSSPPHFPVHVLWPNGWTDQDATWYGGRPWPWRHSVRWRPPLAERA